jgi:hypothetical protein
MTSKEFVIWMKGFITACNDYAPTPKQWDIMKEELEKVSDEERIGTPIGPGWGTPNGTLTVSSGSGGTIIARPGYGSITYNPSTSTQMYPSGSAWSYTTSNEKIF